MRLMVIDILAEHYDGCYVEGAQTLEEALSTIGSNSFDLVIIDPGLPGFRVDVEEDRLHVVSRIVKASHGAKHIVLTSTDSKTEAGAMLKLGINGYLAKRGLSRTRLLAQLAKATPGNFTVQLAEELADTSSRPRQFSLTDLTRRERQVMELMMERPKGQKRKDVYQLAAEIYKIEPSTAEQYFKSAIRKLRMRGHPLGDI
ncbi:MAG: response regulator [Rhizobiaceae bacterium]|nr:response regulator [Rhizobiaceae bacterium]